MSTTNIEQQIGHLAAAILALSADMRQVVGEVVRSELRTMAREGLSLPAVAIAAPAPDSAPAPEPAPSVPAAKAVASLEEPPHHADSGNFSLIRQGLSELVDRIDLTRDHVAALSPANGESDHIVAATSELGSVVEATEHATQHILQSAETMQTLLDGHMDRLDVMLYQELSTQVIEIMTACSFQDITGQRISAAINTLLHVEAELKRLVELWEIEEGTARTEIIRNRPDDTREDKHLLHGPQAEGMGMSQDDIDAMMFG
ncbi:protein phosphatase CheZ [Caenispirillum bisanense]|uniref:protein phosphatase CheZ n=1 Tax=Caenispirillum bisanense TaxID=414052 RepID=UPI0031CDE74C